VLVYDDTKHTYTEEKKFANQDNLLFYVKSARPQFSTSDDALVDWAATVDKEKSLFVTSDRGLRERLSNLGCNELMKTKNWFELVKKTIGEKEYDAIVGKIQSNNNQIEVKN